MKKYMTAIAVILAVALVLYPAARAGKITAATALGGAGLAFLTASLTWRRGRTLAVVAVVLIALHHATALHAAHLGVDYYSVLFALGLYALYEATDLTIALADVAPMTRPALSRRLVTTLSTVAAGALLSVLVLLGRTLFSAGAAGVVVGAVCALGVVAVPIALTQRAG
jgi:uncharacterized membrane protein